MDFNELLNTLANQVAFWQKDNPTTSPALNSAKGVIKNTGRLADTYIGGGMGQAALRGTDALSRQIALNAALMLAGEGVGSGLARGAEYVSPKLQALRQWIKPRDIGVHMSPFDIPERVLPNINTNMGAKEIPGFPLVEGQTYKLSSRNAYDYKLNPNELIDSVQEYISNIPINNMGNKNIYITKSPLGAVDPEHLFLKQAWDEGAADIPSQYLNSRITPSQTIVASKTVPHNRITEETRNELAKLIRKQQSLEKVKSVGRGAVVGGATAGTALAPFVAAKPVLGFNNKK